MAEENFALTTTTFGLFVCLFFSLKLFLQLEPADPDFYKIGYVRSMRAFGVEFKEGPDGFGVYASKDVEPLRLARFGFDIRYTCKSLYVVNLAISMF